MADYLNIAGRVRTTASDGVAIEAQEVKDLNLDKSQQEINSDVQIELGDRYTKEETYNREEIEELVDPTNYVSVVATNATTAATDILPATGEANTIYRVGNWNGTQYDPTMYALFAWNGSAYVCLAVRSFVGEVYDISVNHPDGQGNPTPYADLAAALGNGGANIPADIRRGGMSIKFIKGTVQSIDNNYIQARLMANAFTTDTTQWAIADEGVYVENPEYIYVKTDAENKILWAIKTDGSIYYGAGVPQQVIDCIDEKLAELSLDEYDDIVAFLNGLEKGDKTLQALLNEKVDKEEGKSLVDAEYASTKSSIDNPEFIEATIDAEDKVLEGIKSDGTKVIGGDLNVGGSANINGDVTVKGSVTIDGTSYKVIENPEYIWAIIDNDDMILCGIKTDGKFVADIDGIDEKIQEAINQMQTIIDEAQASIDEKIAAIDEKFDFISWIEDPEGRSEVTTDSEGKIISYRDSSGVLHESSGVDTKVVTAENIYGGNIDSCNFYTGELLCVERPEIAEMWFTGKLPTDTSDARIPTDLDTVFKVNGKTIFKCRCTLALQGHGTLTLPKQGYTFEPYNESGDAISIKFGDMIATDSFHLKGYYTDPLQCKDIGNYHIYADMLKHLDYPYCRMNNISGDYASAYSKDKCSFGDAKYVPDGFPVLFFLNDNFHGIYTLKLKKTRQNYAMEKSTKAQIFLDAQGENRSFFNQAFREDGWDLKNPKIKGYEEGGTITDTGVLENIQRLWSFTTDFSNQYENYSDYIVLPHWILYLIFQELIGNWDSVGNNINVVTWDATHWSIIPWDTDESLGVTHAKNIDTTASNVVVGDIWSDFRTFFADDISAMWTMMRNSGFITVGNLLSYYKDIVAVIPREYYKKDMKKWGNYYLNGVYTINTLAECLNNKIEFLDSIWHNQN